MYVEYILYKQIKRSNPGVSIMALKSWSLKINWVKNNLSFRLSIKCTVSILACDIFLLNSSRKWRDACSIICTQLKIHLFWFFSSISKTGTVIDFLVRPPLHLCGCIFINSSISVIVNWTNWTNLAADSLSNLEKVISIRWKTF